MSQPRPRYRPTGGRCPPLPVPRVHPSASPRWPLILAATALGVLILTLATLTAWVSTSPRTANSGPAAAIEPATPEVAQDEPFPAVDVAKLPVAQEPPPAAQPAPADPVPQAVAVSIPNPKNDPPPAPPADAPVPACQNFGTAVAFRNSPVEAARQADKNQKLLFVLHVSGNFESDCFT